MTTKPTTKQDVCMTCMAEVDWQFDEAKRTWVPYEHGTKVPHRCPRGD